MAFQNLRTGSTVYIFYKSSTPKLDVGAVNAEPKFRQKQQDASTTIRYNSYIPQLQQEQVVDLSIKIGEKIMPIEGLCPALDIQDCGNNIFVSCNREAINAEISAFMHNSELAISDETINAHKNIVIECKNMMMKLNPEIAERQRLKEENNEFKKELREMKGMMARLLEQLEGPVKN